MTTSEAAGPAVVVAEVGASAIRGALVDAGGSMVATKEGITPRSSADDLLQAIATMLGRLRDAAARDGYSVRAVGVAGSGSVDERRGVVHRSANLVWRDTPVVPFLEQRLQLPAVLLQDARAAALGEALVGAGRGREDFLYTVLGEGVGSAVILGGRPLVGRHGSAGEIGHIRVTEGGVHCGCGGRGCVETLASASALTRRYVLARGQVVSVTEIIKRAEGGEAAAQTIWKEAIAALGTALAAAVAVLDCDLVVLGGELVEAAGAVLIRALGAELEGRLSVVPVPELRTAALGDSAGRLGAAGAAFERAGMGRGFRTTESLH
jgi:glucokinase